MYFTFTPSINKVGIKSPEFFRKLSLQQIFQLTHFRTMFPFYIRFSDIFRGYRKEFAKLRAFRAYVPYVPSCLRASNYYLPMCLRALNYYVPTCLRALRAYVL